MQQGGIYRLRLREDEREGLYLIASATSFNGMAEAPVLLPIVSASRPGLVGFEVVLRGTKTQGIICCDKPCAMWGGETSVLGFIEFIEIVPTQILAEAVAHLTPIFELPEEN